MGVHAACRAAAFCWLGAESTRQLPPAVTLALLPQASKSPPCPAHCLSPPGIAPLLEDATTSITLFAPTDEAWAAVPPEVDLKDIEMLQQANRGCASGRAAHGRGCTAEGFRGYRAWLYAPAFRTPFLRPIHLLQILLFQITQGQVVVPDARQMLPEGELGGRRASFRWEDNEEAVAGSRQARPAALSTRPFSCSSPAPDLASGGVNLKLDTLNGAALQVRSRIVNLHEGRRPCPWPHAMLPSQRPADTPPLSCPPTNLQVVAGLDGIALRDGSSLTPDSQVVSANMMVSSDGAPLGLLEVRACQQARHTAVGVELGSNHCCRQ